MSDRELLKMALEALEMAQMNGEAGLRKYETVQIAEAITALRARLAAPESTHPGYIIGSHWLETAYSRICAGEAEADVLRDYRLMREEAFTIGVEHLRQENERLREALPYDWDQLKACRGSLREHMKEIRRGQEALGKYGRHLDDCALTLGGYQCTCGFNQQGVPR